MARRVAAAVAVSVAFFAATSTARADDADPWFGKDKALHASISAAIAGSTYALTTPFFDARYPPLLLGAGVSLTLGAVKELHDLAGYGDPSWKDFTWDVIGTVGGLAVAWGIDLIVRGVSSRHPLFLAPSEAASVGQPLRQPTQGAPAMAGRMWRWDF